MDRRPFISGIALCAILLPLGIGGQQPKLARIGFLGAESAVQAQGDLDNLRSDLRELGYVEGSTLVFEVRVAGGDYDRLPRLAKELADLKVDVLVTSGSKAGIAAKEATSTVPIVVSNMGDAVLAGFSGSFAQPGKNVTGISMMNPEVTARQLGLLREVKPGLERVAVLMNPANPNYALTLAALRREAAASKMHVEPFDVRRADEIEPAIRAAARARSDAMIVQSETLFSAQAASIAALAAKERLASAGVSLFGRAGGLIGYSANSRERWRHVAVYVDRILKGAKPADLPIEQPSKFELVVNLRTAKAIGVTIPQTLLLRADEVLR